MDVINGLPAHALLVHLIVVLAPLTALLEIACAIWPAARRRLVWFTLLVAGVTTVLTPITIDAGEWLYDLRRSPSPILREHADLGEWVTYFAVGLLIVAIALAVLHVREQRTGSGSRTFRILTAILAVAVGISTIVQVYRVGDAGAQSVWGGEIANLKKK